MSDFEGMRKSAHRTIGLTAAILLGATTALADHNWQDTSVEGLLKTFSVSNFAEGNRAVVGFKNITDSPMTFRFRIKCLIGPTPVQGKVAGDSPWFTDRMEEAGRQQTAWGSWEGCKVDETRADGGLQIEVKRR